MWVKTDDNELVNVRNARRIYRKGKAVKLVWGPMDEIPLTTTKSEETAEQIMERLHHALIEGQNFCSLT